MSEMKRAVLLTGLVLLGAFTCLQAQQFQVSGVVTGAEDSMSIPGVAVFIKGTETGTITNFEGYFSLNVPSDTSTLVFSFIGMQAQERKVDGKRYFNIILSPQSFQLKEIVVTALGIRRDSKALGYSATSVSSQEITRSRDRSILNSLQGKVAGVDISSSSGAPGASTRIILRGISSLGGSNQPLFIIDGVPVNNGFSGSTSINGGTDFGNKINDSN